MSCNSQDSSYTSIFAISLIDYNYRIMKRGKQICETLRGVRIEIARANEIDYTPRECHHEGDCAGTCPACESEMRWLEGQLRLRQSLGKAVTIAGLSLGVASLASCTHSAQASQTGTHPQPSKQVSDCECCEVLLPLTTIDSTSNSCNSIETKYAGMGNLSTDSTIIPRGTGNEIFGNSPTPPQYPGGNAALLKDLIHGISGNQVELTGKVIAQFLVDTDGSIDSIKIVRTLNMEADSCVINAIKSLPHRFKPAVYNGKVVKMRYTLPIYFQPQKQ